MLAQPPGDCEQTIVIYIYYVICVHYLYKKYIAMELFKFEKHLLQ